VSALGLGIKRTAAQPHPTPARSYAAQQIIQPSDLTPATYAGTAVQIDGTSAIISAPGRNNQQGGAYIYTYSSLAPNWNYQATLVPSDAMTGDQAGMGDNSAAISVDTAVLGNPLHQAGQGSVAIFTRSGTNWTEQRVIAGPGGAIQSFGKAVALDSNTLAIGAVNTATNRGVVYLYTRSGAVWNLLTTLTPSDPMSGDLFGSALSIRPLRLAIGAPGNTSNRGAVYIYERSGGVWSQTARIAAGDGAAGDNFGRSVSLDGTTVAIGAPNKSNPGANAGAVYVFVNSGGWSQQARLDGDQLVASNFGYTVSLSGDRLVGSQPFNNTTTGVRAFIYQRNGSIWMPATTITLDVSNNTIRPALLGDLLLIGKPTTLLGAGEISPYQYLSGSWTAQGVFTPPDAMTGSRFGGVTAVSGNIAAWGAPGLNFGQGAVYIYALNGTWTLQQKIVSDDPQNFSNLGAAVALYNGSLLAVGETGRDSTGAVALFQRTGTVWEFVTRLRPTDLGVGDQFGNSLAIYNDTLVAGTHRQNNFTGAAYVFKKIGNTWTQTQKLTAPGASARDNFTGADGSQGIAFNGNRIVIGTPGRNNSSGLAYVFDLNGGVYTATDFLLVDNPASNAGYGSSVVLLSSGDYALTASDSLTAGDVRSFVHNLNWLSSWRVVSFGDAALYRGVGGMAAENSNLVLTRNDPANGGLFAYRYVDGEWAGQARFDLSQTARINFEQVALSGNTITTGNSSYDNLRGIGVIFNFAQPGARNDTVGMYDPATSTFSLALSNAYNPPLNSFVYGSAGCPCYPITGDWNGDGVDTVGLYRQDTGVFILRNSNSAGNPDLALVLGNPNDQPIAGRWASDMSTDGVGVFRPSNGILYLRKTLTSGFSDFYAVLGNPGDVGVAGDWDGDSVDTVGVYRPSNATYFITNNSIPNGIIFGDAAIVMGDPNTDKPVVGDWSGIGRSGIGLYRPTNQIFFLKNVTMAGNLDTYFTFNTSGGIPLAGRWSAAGSIPPIQQPRPISGVTVGTSSHSPDDGGAD
jgi:hypothetical protein